MPESVIPIRARVRDWSANLGLAARRILALVIAVAGLVLALAAASVFAIAALAIGIAIAVGLALVWLWARITGRAGPVRFTVWRTEASAGKPEAGRKRDAAPGAVSEETLEAHKGPQGWTVETERRGA